MGIEECGMLEVIDSVLGDDMDYNEGASDFAHLHVHTLFSILDGVARPHEYCELAYKNGWPGVTATEHGVFSSVPDMFWASKEFNLKYVVGCELYFNDYEIMRQELAEQGTKVGKSLAESDHELYVRLRRNRHITVLCKNREGYRNLLKINLEAHRKYMYGGKPRVNFDLLAKYSKGLIILSGCLNGPIAYELNRGNIRQGDGQFTGALDYFKKFESVWGDDFYIEIQMPVIREARFNDISVFRKLVAIADAKKKKMIVSNDSHYLDRKDFEVQKCMMAIDQGVTIDDPELFHVNSSEQFYKDRPELRRTFFEEGYSDYCDSSDFERACDNTLEIMDKCESFEFDTEPKLPVIENSDEELAKQCLAGFRRRGLDKDKNTYVVDGVEVSAKEQMIIELRRIQEKGFSSYFLITKDIVDKAREMHGSASVGPARGSAGGSLLCYLLGITDINPLAWGLSFSRFLSPSRGGMMMKVTME